MFLWVYSKKELLQETFMKKYLINYLIIAHYQSLSYLTVNFFFIKLKLFLTKLIELSLLFVKKIIFIKNHFILMKIE